MNMTFCKNCGSKLQQGQTFCNQCGEKNGEEVPLQPSSTRVKSSYHFPKKAWYYIIPIFALVIIVIGAYLFLSEQYKPNKVIDKFETAVKKKDTKDLTKLMNDGQTEILVKADDVEGYISYLTKENEFSDLVKQLQKQSSQIKGDQKLYPIKDQYGNELFILQKKAKKKWGIFDQYVIKFIPIDVKVSSNFPNTKVSIKGKKAKTIQSEDDVVDLGKTFPGTFQIEAESVGKYSTFKAKEKVDFSEASDNVLEHQINFEGDYISVYSNYSDAEIFINDKDIGMSVGDSEEIGPIATDGSVKIYAKRNFPTGSKKSQIITVTSNDDINLTFDESPTEKVEDPQTALTDFMRSYLSDSVSAINSNDFSYVSDKLDPDGPAYKESKDYAKYLYEKGITEESLNVEVTDYKILDATTFEVSTYEEYNIYSPKKDEDKFRAYKSIYKIKVDADWNFKVNKLVKTTEIK